MSRFSPRPLKSYGVLVDYRMDISDTLPCMRDIVSCYYEPAVFATANDNRFSLRLPLPTECHWMISEGMNSDEGNYISVVIYVVDKISGRQALLYSGTSTGEYDEERDLHYMSGERDFECFDASSFFTVRKDSLENYGALISVDAMLVTSPTLELFVHFPWAYSI